MLKVAWGADLILGIKVIDDQHHHFVDLLNQYDQAVEEHKEKQVLAYFLAALSQYAVEHFATEEKYFAAFDYEETAEHLEAHHNLLSKLRALLARFESGDDQAVAMELADFLAFWLEHHLPDYDKKYVACFKQHGL